jgi:hypothetical protein
MEQRRPPVPEAIRAVGSARNLRERVAPRQTVVLPLWRGTQRRLVEASLLRCPERNESPRDGLP